MLATRPNSCSKSRVYGSASTFDGGFGQRTGKKGGNRVFVYTRWTPPWLPYPFQLTSGNWATRHILYNVVCCAYFAF